MEDLMTKLSLTSFMSLFMVTAVNAAPTQLLFNEFQRQDVAAAPAADCDGACVQLRKDFRFATYAAKQVYCYWTEKRSETGIDYDQLATTLENSIVTGTTTSQYFQILTRWAASFHDGHVNAMALNPTVDLQLYTAPVRFELMNAATDHEKLVIATAASDLTVRAGDVVEAINGVPFAQALDRVESLTSGSTKRMRRFFGARRLLVDAYGIEEGTRPLDITVRRADGDHRVSIYRTAEKVLEKQNPANTPPETGANLITARILPGAIGYLRIDGFSGTQDYFLLNQAMDQLSKTNALLIDVRKNGGGDQSGSVIISRLINNTVTRYRTSERMSDMVLAYRPEYIGLPWTMGTPFADWHDLTVTPAAAAKRYTKPVRVLIGNNCFSACDTFVAGLKANGLVSVVGQATGGGTGTPEVIELPFSNLAVRYSVVRGVTAKGNTIEGVGTSPDVVIDPTPEERVAGRDLQLEKALVGLLPPAPPATLQELMDELPEALSDAAEDMQPIWWQSLTESPTRAELRWLKQISQHDER